MKAQTMIQVEDLTKSFGSRTILDQLDIRIQQGELVGLIGPNGVGKTTLMSILTGLLDADYKQLEIAGQAPKDPDFYRSIGFMQDNSVLYPQLTGFDHLSYVATMQGLAIDRVEEVSREVGNYDYLNQRVGEYSLGMKQHLLFASAIIHQPKVLFLDEPFNGLDPSSLIRIREYIRYLNEEHQTTILMSSHNLNEIDKLAERVIFLKDGQLIHHDLDGAVGVKYLIVLGQDLPENLDLSKVRVLDDKQVLVEPKDLDETLATIYQAGLSVERISEENTGSEDLYREIYGLTNSEVAP